MQDLCERLSHRVAGFRSAAGRARFTFLTAGLILLTAIIFLPGCGGAKSSGTGTPAPSATPSISNINNATEPSSPVNVLIQINGSGFQSSPGSVVFTQSSTGITATVTPKSTAWTNTSIGVNVPPGDGTHSFTVPGEVDVKVTTSAGTSNSMTLSLARTASVNINNVTWVSTGTPLPGPLAGMAAVAVPSGDTQAFVVVTGGFDGSSNLNQVLSNTINTNGQVGPSWQTIPTNPLPETVAYHAMVEADAGNSPVPSGSHFIYVIGGQLNSSGTPGGTTNIYMASVDANSGAVGPWTQLSPLPEHLLGMAATLYNGYVYLIGGLRPDSTPSNRIYTAPVKSDGTLGTWTLEANNYPLAVSFATAFVYSGRLYVLDGDIAGSIAPSAQGNTGVNSVYFANVLNGSVGPWTQTVSTIVNRKKAVAWVLSNLVISAEGVYSTGPGTNEVEYSTINSDGTLAPWIAASANPINANVYNAAAILSPLLTTTTLSPRMVLLGGQQFTTFQQSKLTSEVYYNNAP
jgi:hypothetical protein